MDAATTFDDELPARPSSLGRLRKRFRAWLEPAVGDAFVRDDIVLTMSELAAAMLADHADHAGDQLHAQAWIDDDAIVLEVLDGHGDDLADPWPTEATPGLVVVAALVDVLSVRDVDGATLIRARMDLPNHFGDRAVSP
jgi:hypothetical protein